MYRSSVVRVAISVTVVASLGVFGHAQAADMPAKAQRAPGSYSVFSPNTGWYGYVGTSIPITKPGNDLNEDSCVYLCGPSPEIEADTAYGAIFGAGYRFNPYFRVDFRLGYGWAAVSGTATRLAPSLVGIGFLPDSGTITGNVSGWGTGLNFYLDLKPFWGPWLGNFEPYIGVGVGWARVTFSSYVFSSPKSGITNWPNITDSSFGYTLTAGTAYRINRHWLFDVAYIWRDFGTFESGTIAPTSSSLLPAPPYPTTSFSGSLSGHAIDLGVRYEF